MLKKANAFDHKKQKAFSPDGPTLQPLKIYDKDFAADIKNDEHITGLRSIADLFAKLGLTIEAAPDVNDFVRRESHRPGRGLVSWSGRR